MTNSVNRNAIWMSIGQVIRLFVQACYFTLIARTLGVSNYGAFVGVVALVGMLYPFGALGRGNLLIKDVSRNPDTFQVKWGEALTTLGSCGPLLIGVILLLSRFLLPRSIPLMVVLLVATSDILGLNLVALCGQAFQSLERLHWTATLNVMISSVRLIGALILYSFNRHPTVVQWAYMYFFTTGLTAIVGAWWVSIKLGMPVFRSIHSWSEAGEGVFFSIGLAAQTIYNDIDKTMLVRLSTLTASGIYGAAYRILDVSFAPVSALLYAAYPGLFREGGAGLRSSLTFAKPIVIKAVAYATTVSCAIFFGSRLVPIILGAQYHDTATALRWLSPLPILKAVHYFVSDSLSGAGFQAIRSAIQVSVAIFNVLLNLWLIPHYSWLGASWASLASDGALLVSVCVCAYILMRRGESRLPSGPLPAEP